MSFQAYVITSATRDYRIRYLMLNLLYFNETLFAVFKLAFHYFIIIIIITAIDLRISQFLTRDQSSNFTSPPVSQSSNYNIFFRRPIDKIHLFSYG